MQWKTKNNPHGWEVLCKGASGGKSRGSWDQSYTHSLIQYHPVYTPAWSQQRLKGEGGCSAWGDRGLGWAGGALWMASLLTPSPVARGGELCVFLCVSWSSSALTNTYAVSRTRYNNNFIVTDGFPNNCLSALIVSDMNHCSMNRHFISVWLCIKWSLLFKHTDVPTDYTNYKQHKCVFLSTAPLDSIYLDPYTKCLL